MADGSGGGNAPVTIFEKVGSSVQQGTQKAGTVLGQQAKAFGQTLTGQVFNAQQPSQSAPQGQAFPKMPGLDTLPKPGAMPGFEKLLGGKMPYGQKPPQRVDPTQDPSYITQMQQQHQADESRVAQLRQELHSIQVQPVMQAGTHMMEERRQEQAKEAQIEAEQNRQDLEEKNQSMQTIPNTGSKQVGAGAMVQKRAETVRESKTGTGKG